MKEVAWLEGPESQGTMGLHFQLVLRCDDFFHWCFCVCDEALPKLVLCCIKYTCFRSNISQSRILCCGKGSNYTGFQCYQLYG